MSSNRYRRTWKGALLKKNITYFERMKSGWLINIKRKLIKYNLQAI